MTVRRAVPLALLILAAGGVTADSAAAARACRVPTAIPPLELSARGAVMLTRESCSDARSVTAAYGGTCGTALIYERACSVSADRRRYACSSHFNGGPGTGAQSTVVCRSARRRIQFLARWPAPVATGPPPLGAAFAPGRGSAAASTYLGNGCINTGYGQPAVAAAGPLSIQAVHTPFADAQALAAEVTARHVVSVAEQGLGTTFPGAPTPLNVILGAPDAGLGSGARGVTWHDCAQPARPAIALQDLTDGSQPNGPVLSHELFHAVSDGLIGVDAPDSWFQEASANWFTTRVGYTVTPELDSLFLGDYEKPLDQFGSDHQYGAWRFIQWLDLRGLIGTANWPLETAVVARPAAATATLDTVLKSKGTSLALELGLFWADHILEHPLNGPTADPTPVRIHPGHRDITFVQDHLAPTILAYAPVPGADINSIDITLPRATLPQTVWTAGLGDTAFAEHSEGETLHYCLDGRPAPGALDWPGELEVALVNGALNASASMHVITDASGELENCLDKAILHPACALLRAAGADTILGPDALPGFGSEASHQSQCIYSGRSGQVVFDIDDGHAPFDSGTVKTVRARFRALYRRLGFTAITGLGDLAAIRPNGVRNVSLLVLRRRRLIQIHAEIPEQTTASTVDPETIARRLASGVLRRIG